MPEVLVVDRVSKRYRIYERASDRLKESLTRGRWRLHREFWALSDISFEIEAGTTTGIVGPNGSGKSTLLQIITGILEPTHGSTWHDGRIAALLELGAGFNLEFSGVENVFMNASLMGFSRRETARLLPEIERFAEIGEFVHQPVKTYSSGMYVRLAFATAISMRPQILIVDEALAVGDVVFQHRCMRRIKEMQDEGTTILFVSHDPAAVRALCSRAILLNAGCMIADGKPPDVLNRYQKIIMEREEQFEATSPVASSEKREGSEAESGSRPLSFVYRHGDGSAEILSAELLNAERRPIEFVESGQEVLIRFRAVFHADVESPVLGFLIRNRHGIHVYGTNTKEQQIDLGTVRAGNVIEAVFSLGMWLGHESHSLSFAVHSNEGVSYDWIDGAIFFRVTSPLLIEGVANLNATASVRRLAPQAKTHDAATAHAAVS